MAAVNPLGIRAVRVSQAPRILQTLLPSQPVEDDLDEKNHWSVSATTALLNAWSRCQEGGLKNLTQQQWQEIVAEVNRLEGGKKPKTYIQCRNRLDTLKKSYKRVKRARLQGATDTTWIYFDQLDRILSQNGRHSLKVEPTSNETGELRVGAENEELDDLEDENRTSDADEQVEDTGHFVSMDAAAATAVESMPSLELSKRRPATAHKRPYADTLPSTGRSFSGESDVGTRAILDGLRTMLEEGLCADVTIVVGEEEIKAHRVILACMSPLFKTLLCENPSTEASNIIHIHDFAPPVVRAFVLFLYTGNFGSQDMTDHLMELLALSERYLVSSLKSFIEDKAASVLSTTNALVILQQAEVYKALTLKEACLQYITKHFGVITHTLDYEAFVQQGNAYLTVELTRRASKMHWPIVEQQPPPLLGYGGASFTSPTSSK